MVHLQTDRRESRSPIALRRAGRESVAARSVCAASMLLLVLLCFGSRPLFAQNRPSARPQKLPSAERIVEHYLKAIGGRKRVAAIREATVEYTLQLNSKTVGVA